MSDELRDEYQFDYRQAKPNRFATGLRANGLVLPTPPPGASPAALSDEQERLLETLYAGVPLSVEELPYTDEMDRLRDDFVERSGLSMAVRDVYTALRSLGRRGRLGGKVGTSRG